MKQKLSRIMIVFSIMCMFVIGTGAISFAQEEVPVEATQSAQSFVDMVVANGSIPSWVGANVEAVKRCQDIQGNTNSFLFFIKNDSKVVGYVIIGSKQYEFHGLQGSNAILPYSKTIEIRIKDSLTSIDSLDLKSEEKIVVEPSALMYLGMDQLYAIYTHNNEQFGMNLLLKDDVRKVSEMIANLPSPEEYSLNREEGLAAKAVNMGNLSKIQGYYWFPNYTIFQQLDQYSCGPGSGTHIGSHYRRNGYYGLHSNEEDMFWDLYYYMGTGTSGTTPWNFASGFVAYCQSRGYNNFSASVDYLPTGGDYYGYVVPNVLNNDPLGICMFLPQLHWNSIYGYDDVTAHWIRCGDPATGAFCWRNWDSIGWSFQVVRVYD